MTEPEVSLRLAMYYIKNHLTEQDVKVSIDGAHRLFSYWDSINLVLFIQFLYFHFPVPE